MDNVIWCVLSPLPVARAGICVGTFAAGSGSVRLHLFWLLSAHQLLFMTSEAGHSRSGLTRKIHQPFNPVRTNCQSARVEPPNTDLLARLIWAALLPALGLRPKVICWIDKYLLLFVQLIKHCHMLNKRFYVKYFLHEIFVNMFLTVLFLQVTTCSRTKATQFVKNEIKILPVYNVRKIRNSKMAAGVSTTVNGQFFGLGLFYLALR